jgi:DNA-directed RNA polymerase sigma subunit (sigma70/sigma32)
LAGSSSTDLVRQYLQEIGRVHLLSAEEELTLARLVQRRERLLEQQGDPKQGPALRQSLAAIGLERIGGPGGSQAMAAAIMAMLRPNQASELP